VRDLFNLAVDLRTLPSIGRYWITEYLPGQRVVLTLNPYFWELDLLDQVATYTQQRIFTVVPDMTTQFLLFQEGNLSSLTPRPEDVYFVATNQDDWTLFHNDGAMGSTALWSFNQNPMWEEEDWYEWFTQAPFRQAMSSMTNRQRIVSQSFRGLAAPQYWWFPPSNQFYNPNLRLQWYYSPQRAIQLLASIGITQDAQGLMRDSRGIHVEFDLSVPAGSEAWVDIASVLTDELAQIGITVHIRETEFQALVGQLMSTLDWQTLIIGLTGGPTFPTQGTNVWLSEGNLHMWHPNQVGEAYRDWERRKDYLFRAGMFTIDYDEARAIWDEFQEIMLYQMPVIWIARVHSFTAIQNEWNHDNFIFDGRVGAATTARLFGH
jgi:peptide/nickel transport system substrate-binding protein